MKLSILIPTIIGRENLLDWLLLSIRKQYVNNQYQKGRETDGASTIVKFIYFLDDIEIVYCRDNKELSVGEKRNKLIEAAQGEYVAQVDDDDRVSDDYIKELLEGIETGVDVITFNVEVSLNGGVPKPCYYSMYFENDYNEPNAYYRLPNHLMCVKRELALQVKFLPVNFGEDADYAKRLKPLLKSEHSINKTLYYYDYNSKTTATQK